MKDSPHRDETWDGTREKEKERCYLGNKIETEKRRRGIESIKVRTRGSCVGKEEERGGAGVPLGNRDVLKPCAISLWSLVLVNRVPAVLLFKVKRIHKLIKLSVMINVMEAERYYGVTGQLSINDTAFGQPECQKIRLK